MIHHPAVLEGQSGVRWGGSLQITYFLMRCVLVSAGKVEPLLLFNLVSFFV